MRNYFFKKVFIAHETLDFSWCAVLPESNWLRFKDHKAKVSIFKEPVIFNNMGSFVVQNLARSRQ